MLGKVEGGGGDALMRRDERVDATTVVVLVRAVASAVLTRK